MKYLIPSLVLVSATAFGQYTPRLSDVVRNQDNSIRPFAQNYRELIPHLAPPGVTGAVEYCVAHRMHLPSARELALFATKLGAKGIKELNYFKNQAEAHSAGYTKISGEDMPDGINSLKYDRFWYNNDGYKSENSELSRVWLWSSTLAGVGNPWAYVMNGNGMIFLVDSKSNFTNSVRCAYNE